MASNRVYGLQRRNATGFEGPAEVPEKGCGKSAASLKSLRGVRKTEKVIKKNVKMKKLTHH